MYQLGAERSDENRTQGQVLLKTPTSQIAENGGSQHPNKRRAGEHGTGGPNLQTALLGTPTTRDWKDGPYQANVPTNGLLGRMVWSIGESTNPQSAVGNEFSDG
jgi:hypothetical protein